MQTRNSAGFSNHSADFTHKRTRTLWKINEVHLKRIKRLCGVESFGGGGGIGVGVSAGGVGTSFDYDGYA